jgi:hypothetical protein
VAEGDGKGVGGIIWMRDMIETEDDAHHFLHLSFVRFAVTDNRVLHLGGTVFDHGHAGARRGKQDYSPRLADSNCRGHIPGEEELFDGEDIRVVAGEEVRDPIEEFAQPVRHRPVCACGNGAEVDHLGIVTGFDNTETEEGGTRIDAQGNHSDGLKSS